MTIQKTFTVARPGWNKSVDKEDGFGGYYTRWDYRPDDESNKGKGFIEFFGWGVDGGLRASRTCFLPGGGEHTEYIECVPQDKETALDWVDKYSPR